MVNCLYYSICTSKCNLFMLMHCEDRKSWKNVCSIVYILLNVIYSSLLDALQKWKVMVIVCSTVYVLLNVIYSS